MRILIVKTSSLGDVIHTLPAITDAKQKFPDIIFDWVVEEKFAEIPSWHLAVDKIIPVALRRWRKHPIKALRSKEWQQFRNQLKQHKYDYIIDAQGLIKSAIITRLAKGKRYGLDKKSAREPLAALFYNHKINIPKNQHAITRIRQLFAEILGYEITEDNVDYGLSALERGEKNLVFIHGTTRADKCWPEQNWIELAHKVNCQVQLPWGTEEELARAKRIAAACDNVEVLPKSNLTEIAKILANAKGVVAIDTGLGHLAAALSVSCVSLYGPTDPNLIGTIGKNQIHIKKNTLSDITADDVYRIIPVI